MTASGLFTLKVRWGYIKFCLKYRHQKVNNIIYTNTQCSTSSANTVTDFGLFFHDFTAQFSEHLHDMHTPSVLCCALKNQLPNVVTFSTLYYSARKPILILSSHRRQKAESTKASWRWHKTRIKCHLSQQNFICGGDGTESSDLSAWWSAVLSTRLSTRAVQNIHFIFASAPNNASDILLIFGLTVCQDRIRVVLLCASSLLHN